MNTHFDTAYKDHKHKHTNMTHPRTHFPVSLKVFQADKKNLYQPSSATKLKSTCLQVFCKMVFLKVFEKLTGKYLPQSSVFMKIADRQIFKVFIEHLPVNTSASW